MTVAAYVVTVTVTSAVTVQVTGPATGSVTPVALRAWAAALTAGVTVLAAARPGPGATTVHWPRRPGGQCPVPGPGRRRACRPASLRGSVSLGFRVTGKPLAGPQPQAESDPHAAVRKM
jgi:hypothetical protein